MAIQYNTIMRDGWAIVLQTNVALFGNGSTMTLRLYPTTVPYPNAPQPTGVAQATGHIAQYSVIFQRVGASLNFTPATVTSAVTTAAGTFGWFSLQNSTTYGPIISNSIGLSGSGSVLTVNTMTPGSGTTVNISFNLSMV